MKKIIFIILILQSSFISTLSQEGWVLQYGTPTSIYWRIFMNDSLNGWVLGSDSVFKTTNGGQNWIYNNIGYGAFEDMYFVNLNTGWVINQSLIVKTTNSGQSWTLQFYGLVLYRIKFIDENTGFAVGGSNMVRRTTNSGTNWITQNLNTTSGLSSIAFVNHDTGWIGTFSGIIFKTTNCGLNWIQKNTGTDTRLYGLSFVTPDTGWGVGFNNTGTSRILFTSNGGENWVIQYVNTNIELDEIFFISKNEGWVVGGPGVILHTSNAGISWETQDCGVYNILLGSVYFVTPKIGWTIGSIAPGNGKIFKTTTGGLVPIFINSRKLQNHYNLYQNYPNPFNSSTIIKFDIPKYTFVTLEICDLTGRVIYTLEKNYLSPGNYSKVFDASNLSSGIYFYRLITDRYMETKKLVLIK